MLTNTGILLSTVCASALKQNTLQVYISDILKSTNFVTVKGTVTHG